MDAALKDLVLSGLQPGGGPSVDAIRDFRPFLESLLGETWLKPELERYEHWIYTESDPLFATHYLDRPLGDNLLIAAIWASRYWEAESLRDPDFAAPPAVRRLLSVAASLVVAQLYADGLWDADAVRHIGDRLRSADQVWGAIHECEAFATLVRKGLTPTPCFLRNGSRLDIEAHWQGRAIPVQCKSKEPGASRFLSHELFIRLAAALARDAKVRRRRLLIRVHATTDLQPEDIETMRDAARDLPDRTSGAVLVPSNSRLFALTCEPLADTITRIQADAYLRQYGFFAGMVIGDPHPDARSQSVDVVVGVLASPTERPWETIWRPIDQAAAQLADGPPGIVAIHYFDAQPLGQSSGQFPGWMEYTLDKNMDRYPQIAGYAVSFEPELAAPGLRGLMSVAWRVDPTRVPKGFPLRTAMGAMNPSDTDG